MSPGTADFIQICVDRNGRSQQELCYHRSVSPGTAVFVCRSVSPGTAVRNRICVTTRSVSPGTAVLYTDLCRQERAHHAQVLQLYSDSNEERGWSGIVCENMQDQSRTVNLKPRTTLRRKNSSMVSGLTPPSGCNRRILNKLSQKIA